MAYQILENEVGMVIKVSLHFGIYTTNNHAEYEPFIISLMLAIDTGV